jgi:hypothetical protein
MSPARGYRREQDVGTQRYVAFHVDYRNQCRLVEGPGEHADLRLGYAKDAIAAVESVKASNPPSTRSGSV